MVVVDRAQGFGEQERFKGNAVKHYVFWLLEFHILLGGSGTRRNLHSHLLIGTNSHTWLAVLAELQQGILACHLGRGSCPMGYKVVLHIL